MRDPFHAAYFLVSPVTGPVFTPLITFPFSQAVTLPTFRTPPVQIIHITRVASRECINIVVTPRVSCCVPKLCGSTTHFFPCVRVVTSSGSRIACRICFRTQVVSMICIFPFRIPAPYTISEIISFFWGYTRLPFFCFLIPVTC